ncbi:hypothetical protein [Nocardioides fonticola]|uniref:hypothetical protein n=1 Tax=Nocardioides fonticola TaxID=450363 RepID=UPI0031DAD0CC
MRRRRPIALMSAVLVVATVPVAASAQQRTAEPVVVDHADPLGDVTATPGDARRRPAFARAADLRRATTTLDADAGTLTLVVRTRRSVPRPDSTVAPITMTFVRGDVRLSARGFRTSGDVEVVRYGANGQRSRRSCPDAAFETSGRTATLTVPTSCLHGFLDSPATVYAGVIPAVEHGYALFYADSVVMGQLD